MSVGLLAASAMGQVFSEDFQQGIPAGWTLIDNDGLTPDANVSQFTAAWIGAADFDNTADTVAMSTSWYTPAPGTADDWLITPAINLTTNNILTWEEEAQDPNYPDGYEVRISTTTPTIAGFMANTPLFTTAAASGGTWVQQTVDLQTAGYSNQTVYLAWRNNSTDQFVLMIDDIDISQNQPFDVAMSANDDEYVLHPLTQAIPIGTTGTIDNIGSSTVTNVTMTVNVYDGTMTSVYNGTSTPLASLASGNNATFNVAGYTPTAPDAYTIEYICGIMETDGDMTNDTVTYSYLVSDSTYSRDNAVVDGTLGIGAGTAGQLGQQYVLNAADNLTSVSFFIGNQGGSMTNQDIWAVIYDFNNGQPGSVIGMSDTITIDTSTNTLWTAAISGGPLMLPADTFVVVLQENDSNITVGMSNVKYTPATTWVIFATNPWDHNESYGFTQSYILRANFGLTCPDPVASFTQLPNGSLTHDFTDASTTTGSGTTYMWDFGDGNTSTAQNPTHTYAAAGTYTVCLVVNDSCSADTNCMSVTAAACPDPVASFTSNTTFLQAAFTDGSAGTNISSWMWDFGDGNTSTMQNPTHTYASGGTYTVCLTVIDSCGTDSTCQTVTVTPCVPTAAFTHTNSGAAYTFTDASTGVSISGWMWDFGDGNTSTQQNPMHMYTANGNYNVCLTITDSCGTDSTCQSVTVTGIGIDEPVGHEFNLFPNPTNGQILIQNVDGVKVQAIRVMDVNGRQVMTYKPASRSQTAYDIDLGQLERGLYFIELEGENWSNTLKVVKK